MIHQMYELTIFKNQFDNKTHKRVSMKTWDDFVGLLYGLSKQKGEKGGTNSSPLISPAIFEVDTTRSNKSTRHWGGWCCVDVDDHDFGSDVDELERLIQERFGDYDYVVYNTASSRPDNLKFRLVFRTDEVIENKQIKPFWFAWSPTISIVLCPNDIEECSEEICTSPSPASNSNLDEVMCN